MIKTLRMLSIAATLAPAFVFAQNALPQLPNSGIDSVPRVIQFICTIAGWIFSFLIILAVIYVLIAAFRYLTSQGDSEKISGANQALIYAAVAIAVAVVANALPKVVVNLVSGGSVTTCQ
jgi:magnesium-transporting ATPase (P-type)